MTNLNISYFKALNEEYKSAMGEFNNFLSDFFLRHNMTFTFVELPFEMQVGIIAKFVSFTEKENEPPLLHALDFTDRFSMAERFFNYLKWLDESIKNAERLKKFLN